MIKRLTVMTRKPGMSDAEFAEYWTRVHAPLLASHPAVKRLVLNVTTEFVRFSVRNEDPDDPLRSTILTRRPDSFVELWFADRESMEEMYHSEHTRKLVADAEHVGTPHIVEARSAAISRSGGRNFPGRSAGSVIAASASRFSVGSACK